jgi:hypothetical protein
MLQIIPIAFAAVMSVMTSVTPVKSENIRDYPSTFSEVQDKKICAKISTIDQLIARDGKQMFLLTAKPVGDSTEYTLNVYLDKENRKFTIVKTYAKRNQACIILSGYDINMKAKPHDVKPEEERAE